MKKLLAIVLLFCLVSAYVPASAITSQGAFTLDLSKGSYSSKSPHYGDWEYVASSLSEVRDEISPYYDQKNEPYNTGGIYYDDVFIKYDLDKNGSWDIEATFHSFHLGDPEGNWRRGGLDVTLLSTNSVKGSITFHFPSTISSGYGDYYSPFTIKCSDAQPTEPSQPAESTEKVTLKKLKSVKLKALSAKKLEVKWKKLSKKEQSKIQKFEIQYSTDKTFKTGVKKKWAKKTKNSYTIKGLKKNTKYYVRIRAYKKSGNIIYVSKWVTKNKKTKKK